MATKKKAKKSKAQRVDAEPRAVKPRKTKAQRVAKEPEPVKVPRPHRGGNPPRKGVRSDAKIGVLATSAERERWQSACDARGLTLSAVARAAWDCLATEVEKERS